MAENLAQEIREQEDLAKGIVADAKSKASKMVADAQTQAEQSVKETKQQCHRQWRESVATAEKEADARAKEILAKGEADAKAFYESRKDEAGKTADWLVKEVTAAYGSCRDV